MKRIILLLSTLVMAGFIPLSAQTAAINGFCTNGGKSASVNGLTSSNKLEQIIPSCTVSVYLTGTTTLAPAIYKDAINTPLSNPFTADSLTAVAPGKWLFFAPQNQGYDVVMSGGIAPLTFSSPVTLTDLLVGGGGGGGGGCTPIGLNGVLQASNGVGGCTPAYVQVNGTNLVTPTAPNFIDTATVKVINPGTNQIGFNGVSSSPTIQHNDVTLAGNFSAGTSQILDFNDTTPTPPAGYVNAIFQPDTVTGRLSAYVPSPAGTFVQQLPDPLGTQHVIIYPTGMSTSGTPGNNYGTLTSGLVQTVPQCSGTNNGVISWTYTGALAAQAPWVVPANVTAVYAFGYGGLAVSNTGNNCAPGPNPAPVNYGAGILDNGGRTLMIVNTPTPIFSATELTVLTGATIDTTVGSASISSSGATQSNPFFSVSLLGLIVYYTGTPPPANNAIQIAPPLQYSNATGQPILSLDSTFPQSLSAYSVLTLPPANNYVGRIVSVFDSTDCVTQTGTATSPNNTTCGPVLVGTNYVWAPTTGSGGGGAVSSVSNSDGTLTISPTTGAVVASLALGHANTWTATQTFSNVKDTGAAAGSGTACLQIDTSGLLSNTGTTCGGGGGGGSNVKVNGGTALTTVNLNSTTPAAGALNQNLAFQVDGSGNTSVEVPYGSASNLGVVKVDGTTITASGGVISAPSNGPVCSGTVTLAGATIAGSTAGTNTTVTCTGLLSTDNIMLDFNGSPLSTSGFVPASGGPITIIKYPSANTINITPVNYNASSVTLGSITFNYHVVRGGGGGSGGGGNVFPSTGTLLWVAASRGIVVIDNPQTSSTWSSTSGVVTVNATNSLVADQIVTFDINWGNACLPATGYKVTSATSSTFVISGTSCGTTSGTGGTWYPNSLPEMMREQPYFNGQGTVINDSFSAYTLGSAISDFPTKFKPIIDACVIAGGPCPVLTILGDQDVLNASGSIETDLQTFWALVHAEGGTVIDGGIISLNMSHLGHPNDWLACKQINTWIQAQQKLPSNAASGKYIDGYIDLDDAMTFPAGQVGGNVHPSSAGTSAGGKAAAAAFVVGSNTPGSSAATTTGSPSIIGSIGAYDSTALVGIYMSTVLDSSSTTRPFIGRLSGPPLMFTNNYMLWADTNPSESQGCFGWSTAYPSGWNPNPEAGICEFSAGWPGSTPNGPTTADGNWIAAHYRANPQTSDPGSPLQGEFWYNSTTNHFNFYDGSTTYNLLAGGGSSGGGTVTYTSSQTASSSDNGKIVVMNCSSACAYTLPTTQPSTTWSASVQTIGSTNATIVLGGGDTFNGTTSVPTLIKYVLMKVSADSATSTNYVGEAPLVAGTNVTLTPATNGLTVTASSSASTAFSALTGSTNLTAAMVVGTGASLGVSGSGTITATGLTGSPVITVSSCSGCGSGSSPNVSAAAFSASSGASAVGSVTTSSFTPAVGDTCAFICRGATDVKTFQTSVSETWTALTPQSTTAPSGTAMFYATIGSSGARTATCTNTGGNEAYSAAVGVCLHGVSTLNTSAGNAVTANQPTAISGSITTTQRTINVFCDSTASSATSMVPTYVGAIPSMWVESDAGPLPLAPTGGSTVACEVFNWTFGQTSTASMVWGASTAGQSGTIAAWNY